MAAARGLILFPDQAHRARLRTLESLLLGEADPGPDLQALEPRRVEHGVAVEVDLPAVRTADETEPFLLEEADHMPLGRQHLGLDVAALPLSPRLDLPLGGVEGLADRRVELLVALVGHQLGAGNQ